MGRLAKLGLIILVLMVVAGVIGYLMYNKPHTNIDKVNTDFTLDASNLLLAFESDQANANSKYTGKIIEVSGIVQTKQETANGSILVLAEPGSFFGVNCSFTTGVELKHVSEGDRISIKGECKGYIDDVLLSNCILIE